MSIKKIIYFFLLVVIVVSITIGFLPEFSDENYNDDYINIAYEGTPENIIKNDMVELIKLDSKGKKDNKLVFETDLTDGGVYNLNFDYLPSKDNTKTYLKLVVNGDLIDLDGDGQVGIVENYIYPYNDISISNSGIQTISSSFLPSSSQLINIYDGKLENTQLNLNLNKGNNVIEVEVLNEATLANAYVKKVEDLKGYDNYIQSYSDKSVVEGSYYIQAEQYAYKNNRSINPAYVGNLVAKPSNLDIKYLNVLQGDNFKAHGNSVTYIVNTEKEGMYNLGFSYYSVRKNTPTFVNIYVNDEIPFAEFKEYPLSYSNEFVNFSTDKYVYLKQGINTITVEITQENLKDVYTDLIQISDEISKTGLEIKKLNGGRTDKNRSWNIDEYFPNLENELKDYRNRVEEANNALSTIYNQGKVEETLNLEIALKQLDDIISDIDQIPNKLNLFSDGSNSVAGRIISVTTNIQITPITLNALFLTDTADNLPDTNQSIVASYQRGVKNLLKTFEADSNVQDDKELEVWVKRPKQYYEVMQQMIDEYFTPQTGIEVNLSLLKADDQTKLTLSNAAGTNPDVVTGVDTYYISDIGQRGALEDLTQYEGAKEMIQKVSPGAMMQMYVEDSIYGILETQDFYIQTYRTDVFNELNLEPAQTWDDVKEISAVLQRYGMGYYIPLSETNAFKPYPSTAPFIFQNGGEIFAEDGFSTLIGTEKSIKGFEEMTELFMVYGVEQNVGSFYEKFRDGTVPVGLTNSLEYLKLYFAAPEIYGKWDIALAPGTVDDNGVINRTTGGSGTGVMLFSNSAMKDEGWEFIQWWLSEETQTEYMKRLVSTYGEDYFFFPANLDTLDNIPLPEEHIKIIKEQIPWIREVQRIPGGYVAEREISSVWNNIVVDGKEIRESVESAETNIDRELRRKMEEFDYIKDGEVVKPYKVNRPEDLERWLSE